MYSYRFFINPCFKPFRRGVLELTCCGALSEDKSSWPCHVDFNKKEKKVRLQMFPKFGLFTIYLRNVLYM